MRITRLELAGSTARPAYQLDHLAPGLNVVTGPAGTGKSALADCVAHLLYGRRVSLVPQSAGAVDIESALGSFRLRRVPQPGGPCRLTIAGLASEVAAPGTLSQALRGCSPQFLSGLYYFDGKQSANIDWLLSEGVAADVSRLLGRRRGEVADCDHQETLLARRDELAEQVAQLLAERKRTSESIARHLPELVRRRAEWSATVERTREELHAVNVELTAVTARNRYRDLESRAEESAREQEQSDDSHRLDEVDDQIERWRATLHELDHREAQVRAEIARQLPTDRAAALPLADQRAALAVAERLVQDLQSEVARFARSVASSACVCRDAHPRLQPLASLLQQQIERLTVLNDEHERAVRRRELQTEAHHLSRSQAELRDQLDHLQSQREALSRRARPRRWRSADADNRTVPFRDVTVGARDLEQRRSALANELEAHERQLRELDCEHQRAMAERSALLSDRQLEATQAELAEVQRRLQGEGAQLRALALPARQQPLRRGGRSSDYVAQLTDGKYIELKLSSGGRAAYVVDHRAQTCPVDSLPKAERLLVAISLRLAIVVGLAETGLSVPVILDEPFAPLSDRQAAILAGVLCEFTGHQVLVFTDRQATLEQFRSWNTIIHDLKSLNGSTVEFAAPPRFVPPVSQEEPHGTKARRRREGPRLRVERGRPESKKPRKPRPEQREGERREHKRPKSKTAASPKFFLELQSPIGTAPSIAPETATKLIAAGVRQVRDLLAADASNLAERLSDSDIAPVDIVAWQHQARLCCRIPNLRPREAAILVGAGFSTPEDVAAIKAAELLGFIQSFGQMHDGRELIGDAGVPELVTVERWIRAARQSRTLGAA